MVTSLVQWKFLAKNKLGCKWNSFCSCIFYQKGVELRLYSYVIGWTLKIFMHNGLMFGQWLFTSYTHIHTLLELWEAKAVILHCGKSGRQFRPRSWNNLGLNQPPLFFQCIICYWLVDFCVTFGDKNLSIGTVPLTSSSVSSANSSVSWERDSSVSLEHSNKRCNVVPLPLLWGSSTCSENSDSRPPLFSLVPRLLPHFSAWGGAWVRGYLCSLLSALCARKKASSVCR